MESNSKLESLFPNLKEIILTDHLEDLMKI